MPRNHLLSGLFVVIVAVGGFVYTLAADNEPLLGLDLQGGVSVVYQTVGSADDEALEQTVEIIRSRVDALGVAEPEISRQGDTIVVDLPGVEEQQRALQLVGQTAELRFRPVLLDLGPLAQFDLEPADEPASGETDESGSDGADDEEGSLGNVRERQSGDEQPSDEPIAEDTGDAEEPVADDIVVEADPNEEGEPPALSATDLAIQTACLSGQLTRPEDDLPESFVLLESREGGALCLGPSLLTGNALEGSEVGFDGREWSVNPVFKAGAEGIDRFNAIAQLCNPPSELCPSGRLAIVLDGQSISAPTIQVSSFERDRIVISGSFTEDEARDLNTALRFGALPVELEAQATRTVSATIGDDVLRSGTLAGLIGLGLVAIYLLAYYRLAGLVAVAGLVLSGLMLWSIISWFGATQGLAISLAGVVGLIVAIGVSADSNIVYFENVKDAVNNGRRVPTAVERAFRTSISTIVKADIVSLIAAVLLYFLTVGAVRGFAFYLGVATLLDLFVSYLFMRPALAWFANMNAVKKNPRLLGLRGDIA
jgi:preprotein translocase subunit SecD